MKRVILRRQVVRIGTVEIMMNRACVGLEGVQHICMRLCVTCVQTQSVML